MTIDYPLLFDQMHPGFFDRPYIRAQDPDAVFDEMVLDLASFSPDQLLIQVPGDVSFGIYSGPLDALLKAAAQVEPSWTAYYQPDSRVFCALQHGRIASFCLLEKMGVWQGVSIAGPGCVGTVPTFRKQGIGLRMVQLATKLLKDEGFDLSYIHFTSVAN